GGRGGPAPCRLADARGGRPGRRRGGARVRHRGERAPPSRGGRWGAPLVIPKRWIASYLRFLLRNRLAIAFAISLTTIFFAYQTTHVRIVPQFLDFYPGPSTVRLFGHQYTWRQGHPYINIYNTFRRMFGSANILTVILEAKHGDIYNPTTLEKIDVITKRLTETKGVVPYQILSIAHPKMKSITTYGGAIQVREVYFPGL